MTRPTHLPLRCVSIDVEEYFHVEAARHAVGRDQWDAWPSRVEGNVDRLLALFERCGQRGTFFILGHVAQRRPGLVRRIADAGHEVASHGTHHDRLHRLTPDTFREDLLTSKRLLEDLTGQPVLGYRAPTFSVTRQTAWAIDVLAESGFTYDASIFPVRHPWYGVIDAPLEPFWCKTQSGQKILEVPPLVWRAAGRNLAVAGGGYFRLLPLGLMKRGLRQAAKEQRPAILYFHPWEFDPDMPRMPLSFTGRLRTYTGLRTAERKLEGIMRQPARWTPIRDALDELRRMADQRAAFELGGHG